MNFAIFLVFVVSKLVDNSSLTLVPTVLAVCSSYFIQHG
jgi:hypothetical protein